MPICSKCKKEIVQSDLEKIDNTLICHGCLYNQYKPYKIFPIGFIENELERGKGQFGLQGSKHDTSKIHLFKSQEKFLKGLKDEKWITVIFYFHIPHPIKSTFNRGMDGKNVGIFASRTPDRPSYLGVTEVELLKVEKTTLFVKGLDAINESPVLDIKLGSKIFD